MRTIAALALVTFALPTVVATNTGCSSTAPDTRTRAQAPGASPATAPGAGAAGGAAATAQGGSGAGGGGAAPGGAPAGAPAAGDPAPAAPVLPVGDACPASLIYALGQSGTKGTPGLPVTLYSFDPSNRIFQAIGPVSCVSQALELAAPAECAGGGCLSMAVARDGTLTVFSTPLDGAGAQTVQRIRSSDATCLDSSALPVTGSMVEGSQFVADGAGGESLIVSIADRTSAGAPEFLGHLLANAPAIVDLRSLTGPFTQDAPATRMMTTNGNGHLLFERSGNLLEVDPATANVVGIRTGLSTLTGSSEATASAFWGGSVYYFGATLPGGPTAVTRLDLATGTADLALPETGAYVLAATSGYCAPQVAP